MTNEPAGAVDIPFFDTHIHFWHRRNSELSYEFLKPDYVSTAAGNVDLIKSPTYDFDGYRAESRFAMVVKAVHIQAAIGTADPVQETAWLQQEADRISLPLAIVAGAPLLAANLEAILERHLAYANVRGIRDRLDGTDLGDRAFDSGLRLLAKYDLSLEVGCTWQHMPELGRVAGRHPATRFVLVHMGLPVGRDAEYFAHWSQQLRALGRFDNISCKISGVGLWDPLWTIESIRPWVMECISAFGTSRCFFASNWPIDRQYSSFDSLITAMRECISVFTREEQEALFLHNAERAYRM